MNQTDVSANTNDETSNDIKLSSLVDVPIHIKNLDTGQSIEVRNPDELDVMFPKLRQSVQSLDIHPQDQWCTFWRDFREENEKLWDAGIDWSVL